MRDTNSTNERDESAQFFIEEIAEDDGVVVAGVVRAEQEGELAFFCGGKKRFPGFGMLAQSRAVAFLEFLPFRGIVVEPFAKLVGGRDFFRPTGQLQRLFFDAARPKAVNEDTPAIGLGGGFVSSFGLDHDYNFILPHFVAESISVNRGWNTDQTRTDFLPQRRRDAGNEEKTEDGK